MSLILSGTDGLSDVDGSAATPAIRGTDANTGIFFPAADTIAFSEGGAEAMRIDSSGRVGIGTIPSGSDGIFTVSINSIGLYLGYGASYDNYYTAGSSGIQVFRNGNTERMRIDSSGNVGIGTVSPVGKLNVSNAGASGFEFFTNNPSGGVGTYIQSFNRSGGVYVETHYYATSHTFRTSASATSMVLDSSGNVGVGGGPFARFSVLANANTYASVTYNDSASSPYGYLVQYRNLDPNGTGQQFIDCFGIANLRAQIRSNGGLANYSANNVNLSDRREKTNFAPAGDYLEKICAIPVQTFNYIDQNLEEDDGLTLGVVAQDVQAVAPELVIESNWGTIEEPKMRLSIYQTDLQYALMKCIQEQQALIQSLTDRITALEAK